METGQDGGKRSAWMTHVKKTMRANKGMKLMQVLKLAKKSYKKTRRGGALSPLPLTGARRHRRGGQEENEEEQPQPETMPVVTEKGGRKKRNSRSRSRSRKH